MSLLQSQTNSEYVEIQMIKNRTLIKMAKTRCQWCVSIYLPIARNNFGLSRERLKKLMFDAEKQLLELGMAPIKVAQMLVPIALLLENTAFWKDRKDSLAIFLTPDFYIWFPVPAQMREVMVVNDRFHLSPFLKPLQNVFIYQV